MDDGYSLLHEINILHAYFSIVFLSLLRPTLLHAPLPPSHLRPICPHCVDVLTLTRSTLHGHSDMVVIMRCRCLHKTCCFSLIVIFIPVSLGNEVSTAGTRIQIQRGTTRNQNLDTTEPTDNLFGQNIGTLSLSIISAASIDTFITHLVPNEQFIYLHVTTCLITSRRHVSKESMSRLPFLP
jgi:hypothetical protein